METLNKATVNFRVGPTTFKPVDFEFTTPCTRNKPNDDTLCSIKLKEPVKKERVTIKELVLEVPKSFLYNTDSSSDSFVGPDGLWRRGGKKTKKNKLSRKKKSTRKSKRGLKKNRKK